MPQEPRASEDLEWRAVPPVLPSEVRRWILVSRAGGEVEADIFDEIEIFDEA